MSNEHALQQTAAPTNALIISAETNLYTTFVDALAQEGVVAHSCDNVIEADQLIAKINPVVIIIDANLRDESGISWIRQTRELSLASSAAILVCLKDRNLNQASRAIEAGADDVLTPPLDPYDLRIKFKAVLRTRQERIETQASNDRRAELTHGLLVFVDLCAEVSSTEDLEEVVDRALNATINLTQSRSAALLLKTLDTDQLTVAATHGDPFGPCGAAVERNATINDAIKFQKSLITMEEKDGVRQAAVYVPLVASEYQGENRCLGVLYASHRLGADVYTESDLQFLELLSGRAATAVQQAISRFWNDQARDALVRSLISLTETRDEATGMHLERVTNYAIMLAEQLKSHPDFESQITGSFIQNLRWSVPLHDIGKVAIPDGILLKPGKLTDSERKTMQTHANIGGDTLRSARQGLAVSDMLEMAEQIACHHHEWYNGKGYPDGLQGDDIPLCARIAALADVYDAVTSHRTYKDAFSHEHAQRIILESRGTQFDPRIVDAFIEIQDQIVDFATQMSSRPNPPDEFRVLLASTAILPWWLFPTVASPSQQFQVANPSQKQPALAVET